MDRTSTSKSVGGLGPVHVFPLVIAISDTLRCGRERCPPGPITILFLSAIQQSRDYEGLTCRKQSARKSFLQNHFTSQVVYRRYRTVFKWSKSLSPFLCPFHALDSLSPGYPLPPQPLTADWSDVWPVTIVVTACVVSDYRYSCYLCLALSGAHRVSHNAQQCAAITQFAQRWAASIMQFDIAAQNGTPFCRGGGGGPVRGVI